MVVIGLWTGREARALRLGLRMTIETFGEHLGVAARTVAKWEAQGSGIVPVPTIQEVLDTALRAFVQGFVVEATTLKVGPIYGWPSWGQNRTKPWIGPPPRTTTTTNAP